jgi:hypothetical protein
LRISGSTAAIYIDGSFVENLTVSDKATIQQQTIRTILYGAYRSNTTIQQYTDGTGYGFFIKGSSTELSAQNISDMDSYFAAL